MIYDTRDYSVVSQFAEAHTKLVRSVAWKPGLEFPCLAAGSFDATVSIWAKTDDGFEYDSDASDDVGRSSNKQWLLMAIIEGHENEVKGVAWSLDGVYLALCSRDKTVWVWESDGYNDEFECVNVLQEYHTQDIKHVAWGPDQHLVLGLYDDTIKVFKEPSPGEDLVCVADLACGHTVWCVECEKSDSQWRFASAGDDGRVRVWKENASERTTDTETWEVKAVLDCGPKDCPVYLVSWSKDGRLAAGGAGGVVVVWGESDGKWTALAEKRLAHGVFEVNSVAWIGDEGEEKLATAGDDGTVCIWEV